jgi:rhodanese-related sulfurtransferase/DNA-binding transcriptional ArsR family regulator
MDPLNSEASANELFSATARGLAHPKRLQLLNLLAQTERSVEDLAAVADLPVATTSAQLQTLRRSGLIARRREGTRIYYRLANDHVLELLLALQRVTYSLHAGQHLAAQTPAAALTGDLPVRSVARDELLRDAQAGQVAILDVRPVEEYDHAHIPGAVSVPLDELAERLEELPEDVEVVAYCRGAYCLLSHDAVRLLQQRGRRASVLDHGMNEWRAAGEDVGTGR